MEAVQKDHWYFMVLLFLPFLKASIQLKDTIHLEEDMVLTCLCPWDGNLSMVSWIKMPDKNPIAVFHPEYGVAFSRRYKGRIEFLKTTSMDGSISIRNVTHEDIGIYQCSVQTFPQGPWTRNIQVEDLDEPPEEDSITETSAPKMAVADMELVAELNNNVTISSNHKHNGTVYQVILERMPHGQPWSIIGVCKKLDGGLDTEDYSDRGMVNCGESLDVSLRLTDVVQEDGGFYRFTFSTDAGEQTTTVLLTISAPGGISLSVYMMYIYIGAGSACLVLLVVIITLAVRHRKKSRREEYRVRLHPSQRQPNYYENIPMCPRVKKKSRQIRNCPVYANLQTVRSHQTRRQPCDK